MSLFCNFLLLAESASPDQSSLECNRSASCGMVRSVRAAAKSMVRGDRETTNRSNARGETFGVDRVTESEVGSLLIANDV